MKSLGAFPVKFGMQRFDLHTTFPSPKQVFQEISENIGKMLLAQKKSHISDDNVKFHNASSPEFLQWAAWEALWLHLLGLR